MYQPVPVSHPDDPEHSKELEAKQDLKQKRNARKNGNANEFSSDSSDDNEDSHSVSSYSLELETYKAVSRQGTQHSNTRQLQSSARHQRNYQQLALRPTNAEVLEDAGVDRTTNITRRKPTQAEQLVNAEMSEQPIMKLRLSVSTDTALTPVHNVHTVGDASDPRPRKTTMHSASSSSSDDASLTSSADDSDAQSHHDRHQHNNSNVSLLVHRKVTSITALDMVPSQASVDTRYLNIAGDTRAPYAYHKQASHSMTSTMSQTPQPSQPQAPQSQSHAHAHPPPLPHTQSPRLQSTATVAYPPTGTATTTATHGPTQPYAPSVSSRDKGWSYAYSYASSTVHAHDADDHKIADMKRAPLIRRPSLQTELKPSPNPEEMKTTNDTYGDYPYNMHRRTRTLYDGLVTEDVIEIHDCLCRSPRLTGPVFLYRNDSFAEFVGVGAVINERSYSQTSLSKHDVHKRSLQTAKDMGYNPIFALPIQSIVVDADITLDTALIEMKITFVNNCGQSIENGVFALPMMNGTVMRVSACIQQQQFEVEYLNKQQTEKRFIETFLVDADVARVMRDNEKKTSHHHHHNHSNHHAVFDGIFNVAVDEYITDLFRFPVHAATINADDCVEITIRYQQTLEFNEGRYHLMIPLQFDKKDILPNNINLSDITHINVTVNSLLANIKFGSNSHRLRVQTVTDQNAQTHLHALPYEDDIYSRNFHFAYYIETAQLTGCGFIEHDDKAIDGDIGHFVLYINPSTDESALPSTNHCNIFSRDIIFLIDRSGSMLGSSHSKVIQAVSNALDMLSFEQNGDRFGIVCFNEAQIYFHGMGHTHSSSIDQLQTQTQARTAAGHVPETVAAAEDPNHSSDYQHLKSMTADDGETNYEVEPPKNPLFAADAHFIENAKQFVVNHGPEGGTDIATPLQWALQTLDDRYRQQRCNSNSVQSIPFVVLITDGCDTLESTLLPDIEAYCCNIRILTFGIGKYCNPHFLRLLASKSRGWSDHVLYACDVKQRLEALIERCYAPILKDLSIEDGIAHNHDITLHPSHLPDIYLRGAPIVVHGTYKNGELPQILTQTENKIRVSGITINGQPKTYEFMTHVIDKKNPMFSLTIHSISLKTKLHHLSALHWLNGKTKIKKQILALSTKQNYFPSVYSSMISFKCNATQKKELDRKRVMKTASVNTLNIDSEIMIVGVINKQCGAPHVNHNLCGIYDSVGSFIDDELEDIESCACCQNVSHCLKALFSCCCCFK